MSRQIKFRAWDKENNKMFDVVEISYEDNITLAWREPYENEPVSWSKSGLEVGKECEMMQWTGLYDDKGNKIFEGDILRDQEGNIGKVKWIQEHCAFLRYISDPAGYYLIESGNGEDSNELEVIGNIFENPKLLNNL